jgi:pilus assembly protein FimV
LRAEIELTAPTKEEMASLSPKLASMEAFKKAGIEFHPALLSLRFVVEPKGSGYVIRVTSTQAINEPFLEFLVEMTSGSGRVMREYTFLLDPAELSSSQAPQISQSINAKPIVPQVTKPVEAKFEAKFEANSEIKNELKPLAPAKSPVANKPAKPIEIKKLDAQEYRVKSGDTLVKIATAHMPGVSLDQVLVSIYNANPNAFVGSNMNRLKAGQVITLPSSEAVQEVAKSQAQTIVRAHASDFNAYRNKLAGHVSEMSLAKPNQAKSAATGAITAKVKEVPTASNESLDKLKLSKVDSAKTKGADISKETAEIERIAKAKADQENSQRIKELEKNVNDLNKILEVRNRDLAAKQNAASAANVTASKAASMVAASKVDAKADAKPEVKASKEASASSATATAASTMASTTASTVASSADESAASNVAKTKKPRPAPPAPPPVEETDWLSSTYMLPVGGILALLAGLGLFISNRRKKKANPYDDSSTTGSNLKSNSMFGSTGGQSVDTNNSVFNSNFAPSASQLDANEVDPVAEADVYIAYGRDTQAEDILKEALRSQPDRHAVRLKLLEIYFTRKDARSFELYAGDLYGMTAGQGPEWAQASAMGKNIDPNNPLYAGAQGEVPSFNSSMGSPTMPLEDLNSAAMMEHALSEDMLDSISIIDIAAGLSEENASSDKAVDQQLARTFDSATSLESNELDFDLGIEAPSEDIQAVSDNDLSMPAMDSFDAILKGEVQAPVVASEPEVPVIDFGSIDFDLGDDTPDPIPAKEDGGFAHSEGLDWSANDLAAKENSSNVIESDEQNDEIQIHAADVTNEIDAEFDSPINGSDDSVLPSVDMAPPAFDLGTINFDLPESNSEESNLISNKLEEQTPSSEEQSLADLVESDEVDNPEMATKLDLALAYQEIGDKEGARELLEEVKIGGSKEQQMKATEMLSTLV